MKEEKSDEAPQESGGGARADLSSLTSMLQARWKGAAAGSRAGAKQESVSAGQVRSFRISRLDAEAKKIELEMA